MVYALPALALLTAAAVPLALRYFRGRGFPVAGALLVLLLAPAGLSLFRLAVPECRADWPAATGFVMRNYRPSDQILSNAWEPGYYFRALGPAYHVGLDQQTEPQARVWVLISSASERERQTMIEQLLQQDRPLLQRQSFALTTVCCLGQMRAVANSSKPVANIAPAR
jgi:hypothetical protein